MKFIQQESMKKRKFIQTKPLIQMNVNASVIYLISYIILLIQILQRAHSSRLHFLFFLSPQPIYLIYFCTKNNKEVDKYSGKCER